MRLHALDSLRGLAAFAVVIYHCLVVYPDFYSILGGVGTSIFHVPETWVAWLTLFPARLIWAGREAVLFFFVLSGFVLTLAYLGPRPPGYLVFITKRFCRLYLPFAVMIIAVAVLWLAVDPQSRPELSKWFTELSWSEYPTPFVVLRHLAMTGGILTLNNVSWTLVVEWRVALIFPLLVLLCRTNQILGVTAGLGLVALHFLAESALDFGKFYTLSYIIYFIFGILLAIHRVEVCAYLEGLPRKYRVLLWVAVYLLLNARWLSPWPSPFADIANGLGATLLIAAVLTSPTAERILTLRPLLWLGVVSYSLYLVHVPMVMTMVHLLGDHLPLVLVLGLVPPVSLLVAYLFHRLVEDPSTELGRRLAQRVSALPLRVRG